MNYPNERLERRANIMAAVYLFGLAALLAFFATIGIDHAYPPLAATGAAAYAVGTIIEAATNWSGS